MDTPCALLKAAVYETDDQQRIQKAIRACKIITDILPYEKKNEILLEEPELIKFLILALPMLSSPISMIMNSMIQTFKRNITFVHYIWEAIEYVSTLDERQISNPLKLLQLNIQKVMRMKSINNLETFDDTQAAVKRYEYCDEILKNKETIKTMSLDYAEEIAETIYKELKDHIDFLFEPFNILKKFIQNTNYDKVITKALNLIEKLKQNEPNKNIDVEIQEVLLYKKDTRAEKNNLLKTQEDGKNNTGAGSKPAENKDKKNTNNKSIKDIDKGYTSNNSVKNKDNKKKDQKGKVSDSDSDSESIIDDADDDHHSKSDVNVQIEEWLVSDEIPLFSKSEFMMEAIKIKENFETLILFITDPQLYLITSVWSKNYPEYLANRSQTDSPLSKRLRKLEERYLVSYILRSYKTMIALTDLKNFKYIMSINKNAVENYFNILSKSLKKEESNCNMNHVAKVTEYFLKRETDMSISYILHYNLLYIFIQNIEFQYIQQLLLTIFNSAENSINIGDENLRKVLKYCKYTSFFNDLGNVMLFGEKELDAKKVEVSYKPNGVEELTKIKDEINTGGRDDYSGISDRSDTKLSTQQNQLVEEINGFKTDIDGIKQYIRGKQSKSDQTKTAPKVTPSNSSSAPKRDLKDFKKYPSIAEKLLKIEQLNKLKQMEASQKRSTKYPKEELGKINQVKKQATQPNNVSVPKNDMSHLLSERSSIKPGDISIDKISDISKTDKKSLNDSHAKSPPLKNKRDSNSETHSIDTTKSNENNKKVKITEGGNKDTIIQNKTKESQSTIEQKGNLPTTKSPEAIKKANPTDDQNRVKQITQPDSKSNKPSNLSSLTIEKAPQNQKVTTKNAVNPPNVKANKVPQNISSSNNTSTANNAVKSTPHMITAVKIDTSMTDSKLDQSKNGSLPSPTNSSKPMLVNTQADRKISFDPLSSLLNDKDSSYNNKIPTKKVVVGAQSLATGFFDDGVITKKGIEQLNLLYPVPTKSLIETEIDKEAKKFAFSPTYIKENDIYAYSCYEFLDILIRKNLYSIKEVKFKKLLGLPIYNDNILFWSAIFESHQHNFFEKLMKNYLYKIKVHHQLEINSGFAAGNLVNLLLENISTNEILKKYFNEIHNISKALLPFLCKTIISSHVWPERKNLKVYLQSYVVNNPLGAGRLLLVTTLKIIIWNDYGNSYSILNEINDTCWHTLIIWLYENRTNNLYNQMFYSILEKIFETGNEKLLIIILFKLNLLSNLSKILDEICVNGILLRERYIDSTIYAIASIISLIKSAIKDTTRYSKLIEQLNSNLSWKDLRTNQSLPKIPLKELNRIPETKKITTPAETSTTRRSIVSLSYIKEKNR